MPEASKFVTVAEASERWGVPARRVRHVLERSAKRGETAPETFQKTFRTRTGERSAVAYPVAWLGALLEANISQAETLQHSEGERSANEAKQSAEPFQHSAPERFEDPEGAGDWRARALVAEARAELLERELGDWKGQALSLTEALQRAQNETRAVRALSSRPAMQIEAAPTPGGEASMLHRGDSSQVPGPGDGITPPSTIARPWWQFWRRFEPSGKGRS